MDTPGAAESSNQSSIIAMELQEEEKPVIKRTKIQLVDSDEETKQPENTGEDQKKIEEPENSPFEIIEGLHQKKLNEHFEKSMKNELAEETLMTKHQYANMFKHIEVSDCNIVVQKLK